MMPRRYIRHPARLPISVEVLGGDPQHHDRLRDIGEGGLCFSAPAALEPGAAIGIAIPVLGQVFEVGATVAWCQPGETGYLIGARFRSPQERLCVRMVEQLCYIADYRLKIERQEGRRLSDEEAAIEWLAGIAGRLQAAE